MHIVIYGAGGVGGTIGARLHMAGAKVTLIARGDHLHTLQQQGLRFVAPDAPEGGYQLSVPVVGSPAELDWCGDEVVMLTMKSQHTEQALEDLHAVTPNVPVVCAQNGVANERMASARFAAVISMVVWLPAVHVRPGEVITHAQGKGGVLDCGQYPQGSNASVQSLSEAIEAAGFSCRADAAVLRWKYAKLLSNLGNAPQALLGDGASRDVMRALLRELRDEALACYTASGVQCATADEVRDRHKGMYQMVDIAGHPRQGGSTWQSVHRGTGNVETDFLNGEIVRMGEEAGVPTPVNRAMVDAMRDLVAAKGGAGSVAVQTLEDLLLRYRNS